MSARSVCSGTRPSRYHSTRAISAPPRRPQQVMRMPRPLHHTAERHAALELLRNVVGHELRVDLRLADFDDVQMHFVGRIALDFVLQLLDIRALFPDDDTGTCRMDRDAALLVRTLDDDARDARLLQAFAQML